MKNVIGVTRIARSVAGGLVGAVDWLLGCVGRLIEDEAARGETVNLVPIAELTGEPDPPVLREPDEHPEHCPEHLEAGGAFSTLRIRAMVAEDLEWVESFDRECFNCRDAWSSSDFIGAMADTASKAVVADNLVVSGGGDDAGQVDGPIGYLATKVVPHYQEHDDAEQTSVHVSLECLVCRLAVAPTLRRMGIGSLMVRWLKDDIVANGPKVHRIVAEVDEDNLPAQLFFRACGFVATAVLSDGEGEDATDDGRCGLDAYEMIWRTDWK